MGFDIAKHITDFGLNENRDWLASAHGTEATRTGTLDVSTLVADTHFPTGGGLVKSGTAVALHSGSGLWQPYSALDAVDEVQTLTRTSTGGTVDLTFDGETATGVSASAAGFTAAAVTITVTVTAFFFLLLEDVEHLLGVHATESLVDKAHRLTCHLVPLGIARHRNELLIRVEVSEHQVNNVVTSSVRQLVVLVM